MIDKIKSADWGIILQLLFVAALSTLASGYVSGRIVESKMEYVIQEIRRIDENSRETRTKLEQVQLQQAGSIGRVDANEGRINRLESRR